MRLCQYKQPINPYDGVAQSAVTSNPFFMGDGAMITGSLTTSSATASKWTVEGFDGPNEFGFTAALPSGAQNTGGWQLLKTLTAQGYFSMDTIPSWGRVLRTPSNSSSTLMFVIHVGP